jgi:serine/threonine protein kinase
MLIVKSICDGTLWNNYKSQYPKQRKYDYIYLSCSSVSAWTAGSSLSKYFKGSHTTTLVVASIFATLATLGTLFYFAYRSPSSTLKWPVDKEGNLDEKELNRFGLANYHHDAINNAIDQSRKKLRQGFVIRSVKTREGTPAITKHELQVVKTNGVVEQVIERHDTFTRVELSEESAIVMTKKVLSTGKRNKRKVKLCYDLEKGKPLVRKKCLNAFEKRMANEIIQKKPRGVEQVSRLIDTTLKNGTTITEMISPEYKGPLSENYDLINSLDSHGKLLLIEDLLHGLDFIHSRNTHNPLFHSDVHPDNILFRYNEEHQKYEAVLSDFDMMNAKNLECHFGYRSPEGVAFNSKDKLHGEDQKSHIYEVVTHNKSKGQAQDMWQLGLTMATILGSLNKTTSPKIKCLEDNLKEVVKGEDSYKRESRIYTIKQKSINRDLHQMMLSLAPKVDKHQINPEERKQRRILEQLLKLNRALLQVDPSKRFTAKQALKQVKYIRETFLKSPYTFVIPS